jgi:hypothetical protein
MNTPETSTGNNEWYTPPDIVEALLGAFPAEWRANVFDPASCAVANGFVRARHYLTEQDDALAATTPWKDADIVWMNPPYSRGLLDRFVDRFLVEVPRYRGGCVLVNSSTETRAWQQLLAHADAVFFPGKRIQFLTPAGERSTKQARGQTVFYFGDLSRMPTMPGVGMRLR